jgi:hypothetical protein
MTDPATYRKYAEECRRLATRAPENDRRLLLQHADVWLKLAEEAPRRLNAMQPAKLSYQ